jgi:hypothetical protein
VEAVADGVAVSAALVFCLQAIGVEGAVVSDRGGALREILSSDHEGQSEEEDGKNEAKSPKHNGKWVNKRYRQEVQRLNLAEVTRKAEENRNKHRYCSLTF